MEKIVLFFAIPVAVNFAPALSLQNYTPFYGIAKECGQILHLNESAGIEYKAKKKLGSYRICPFIVRVAGAGSLKFDIRDTNLWDDGTKITIATIDITKAWPYTTLLHSQDIATGSLDSILLPGSIAIITLALSPNYNGSINIAVEKLLLSEAKVSSNSVDQIWAGQSGSFTYPSGSEKYDNHEISTFLVAPKDFVSDCPVFGCTRIQYKEIGIERDCFDRVDIFHYIRDFSGGWLHSASLCGGICEESFSNLGEMALIVFATDRSGTQNGFSVYFQTSVLTNDSSCKTSKMGENVKL